MFVAGATLLRSRCLATVGRIRLQTHKMMDGFMKHAVETGSGAIIYIYIYLFIY
jgi:hypothetical protein